SAPVDVLMDIEPRGPEVAHLPGRALNLFPVSGEALRRAAAADKPIATEPFNLIRKDGAIGVALVAPVTQKDGTILGFITFSYRLGPLMLVNDEASLFDVVLQESGEPGKEYKAD